MTDPKPEPLGVTVARRVPFVGLAVTAESFQFTVLEPDDSPAMGGAGMFTDLRPVSLLVDLLVRAYAMDLPVVLPNARRWWPHLHARTDALGLTLAPEVSHVVPLLDPIIIDARIVPPRDPLARRPDLATLAKRWELDAHYERTPDALAAILARRMVQHDMISWCALSDLRSAQANWFLVQRDRFNDAAERRGKPDRVRGEWPWNETTPPPDIERPRTLPPPPAPPPPPNVPAPRHIAPSGRDLAAGDHRDTPDPGTDLFNATAQP